MHTLNKNYQIIGNGKKTIVFAHYFGGDSGSWQWLVKRLKKIYTCVLIDLPGFNDTKPLSNKSIFDFANYINSCITELKLTDYTLCGHSMSGKLVLYSAILLKTNRPEKLILIAPSPPTTEDMPLSEKKRMLNHPNLDEAVNTVENVAVKNLGKKRFDYAVQSQLRIEDTTWNWWINEGMDENITDQISGLNIPSYVICSKEDPAIKIDAIYKEVLPYLKNPSVIIMSNVGHLIPMETPKKLAEEIEKILNEKLKINCG